MKAARFKVFAPGPAVLGCFKGNWRFEEEGHLNIWLVAGLAALAGVLAEGLILHYLLPYCRKALLPGRTIRDGISR